MKRLYPEAVRLPTVAGGRRRQPARGDARGCLVVALLHSGGTWFTGRQRTRADDPYRRAGFLFGVDEQKV